MGMASAAQVEESVVVPRANVGLGAILVLAVIAGAVATAGSAGAMLWLAKHQRLTPAAAAEPAPKKEEAATQNVVLEPLLVNLADADGHSYLRLGVTLAEAVDKDAKKEEGKPAPGADAAVRDAVLSVLGKKQSGELLQPDGKDVLKREVKAALDAQVPKARVQAVYFTDFLVQR